MDIQLPPDIESNLRQQAQAAGMDAEQFAIATLLRQLAPPRTLDARLPREKWKAKFDALLATIPERDVTTPALASRESFSTTAS